MSQHSKFKLFSFPQTDDLAQQVSQKVAAWVQDNMVRACSIGVEYLERSSTLLVSLGYQPGVRLTTPWIGEPGPTCFPVEVHLVKLGTLPQDGDLSTLESRLEEAAQQFDGVVCHEFYVTDLDEVVACFLVCGKG